MHWSQSDLARKEFHQRSLREMKLNLLLLGLGIVQASDQTNSNEVDDLGNKKNKNKNKNKNSSNANRESAPASGSFLSDIELNCSASSSGQSRMMPWGEAPGG